MRNVMVRCIFSVFILAVSHGIEIRQDRHHALHGLQWSDQQYLADDWQPFVPSFVHAERGGGAPYQVTYPRTDTVRQFFGKNVETVHNSLKKSFQAAPAAANNVDQYAAVPSVLGSFNSFSLQTARSPLLDKNIKDGGQYFDGQSSHFPVAAVKYQSQSSGGHQSYQRFPAYVPAAPQLPKYQPINQQYHHHQHYQSVPPVAAAPAKQTSSSSPPRTAVSTSVQLFPPQQTPFASSNAYFLGVPAPQPSPPKTENYVEDEPAASSYNRKQTRPNDYLLGGGGGGDAANNGNRVVTSTIYGTKDAAALVSQPFARPTPFTRPEIQNHFLYEPILNGDRYESNDYNKVSFPDGSPFVFKSHNNHHHQHLEHRKKVEDNPSKQVYEQLSHYGRPFTLPKESSGLRNVENKHVHADGGGADGLIHSYSAPAHHYKKEKTKTYHKGVSRAPILNSVYGDATTDDLRLFEPKQTTKAVAYLPSHRDVIRFSEEDVSTGNLLLNQVYQTSEKQPELPVTPFLPTPTESYEHEPAYVHYQKYTTPGYDFSTSSSSSSRLPANHKYSNRHRFTTSSTSSEPTLAYYVPSSTETADDDRQRPGATDLHDYRDQYYETSTTTKKAPTRRRKPSKNKTKEYNRQKVNAFAITIDHGDNGGGANAVDAAAYQNVVVASETPVTKKKPVQKTTTTPPTTTEAADENYPSLFPSYAEVKQQQLLQRQQQQQQQQQQQYNYPQYDQLPNGETEDTGNYFNSQREETAENYPFVSSTSATTTTAAAAKVADVATTYRTRTKTTKFANTTRPRFSIKDYKRGSTTTALPTTTAAGGSAAGGSDVVGETEEKKNARKSLFAARFRNRTDSSTDRGGGGDDGATASTESAPRKYNYKPRVRTNKYKSSVTSSTAAADTTSERSTFKPSTLSRRSSTTSKYFGRYRTTTEVGDSEAEDEPVGSSSDKKPVKTLLYSAKRTSLMKPKASTTAAPPPSTTTPRVEYDDEEFVDDEDDDEFADNEAEKPLSKRVSSKSKITKLDKVDDISQTDIMTSAEEEEMKDRLKGLKTDEDDGEVEIGDAETSTEGSTSATSSTQPPAPVVEERSDYDDRVSQVSSLTSGDRNNLPASYFNKWPATKDNQNE